MSKETIFQDIIDKYLRHKHDFVKEDVSLDLSHEQLYGLVSFVLESLSSDKVTFQCGFWEPTRILDCRDYDLADGETDYNLFEALDVDVSRFKNYKFFSLRKFRAVDNEQYIVKEFYHDLDCTCGTAIFEMTKERFLSFEPYIPRNFAHDKVKK